MALAPMLPRRIALATGSMAGVSLASWKAAIAQSAFSAGAVPAPNAYGRELLGIRVRASEIGLSAPMAAAAGRPDPLELALIIDHALAKGADPDALNLAQRAGLLLSDRTRDARDGVDFVPTDAAPASVRYPYSKEIKDEYATLYKTAKILPGHLPELQKAAKFINADTHKTRYRDAGAKYSIPWFVVGALHYREASLNFMGHLHNGDPLYMQTVHVPTRRPPLPWTPAPQPSAEDLWRLSAEDALRGLPKSVLQWTVQRMCYGLESYNGFGCRSHGTAAHPVNTPYLWNYTDKYTGGGFYSDHQFSPTYISKQAGVIAIIKALHDLSPADVQMELET